VPSRTPNLPKNLFIFWDKGFDSAPDICQYCLQSWRDMNPSWQINVLDQESANDIVYRNSFPDHMKIAHYADVLRTNVLATKGGVWADATLLCLKPLDDWLPLFFCQSPFFVFYRPGKDRMLSNWFISAESSSILIEKWCDKTNKYWYNRTSKADTYFWHHYLFESILATSPDARSEWKKMPKVSAGPPHLLKRALGKSGLDIDTARIIAHTPVQKLSHKGKLTPAIIEEALRVVREAAA